MRRLLLTAMATAALVAALPWSAAAAPPEIQYRSCGGAHSQVATSTPPGTLGETISSTLAGPGAGVYFTNLAHQECQLTNLAPPPGVGKP